VLQGLLHILELLVILETVQMRQHTHDLWHAMLLKQHEEFERFHLKAEFTINQQQDQIRHFRHVNHAAEVLWTLQQRDAPFLARDNSDGACGHGDRLPSELFDQTFDQSGFADTWRPLNQHQIGSGLIYSDVKNRGCTTNKFCHF
jgi:hypothetical protein